MKCNGNPPAPPGDPGEEGLEEGEISILVQSIEILAGEIDAGRPLVFEDLEPWEWAGLVAWRTQEKFYDRLLAAKIAAGLLGNK